MRMITHISTDNADRAINDSCNNEHADDETAFNDAANISTDDNDNNATTMKW